MNDHLIKRRWMEEHGYTLEGGIYDIQIAVPNHAASNGVAAGFKHKHMISAEKVDSMTIDELEAYDQDVWLKARQEIARLAVALNNGVGRWDED